MALSVTWRVQVLRVLLKLLETSRESRTLAVGASDLGNFISAHPHGRSIVTGEATLLHTALPHLQPVCPCIALRTYVVHLESRGVGAPVYPSNVWK